MCIYCTYKMGKKCDPHGESHSTRGEIRDLMRAMRVNPSRRRTAVGICTTLYLAAGCGAPPLKPGPKPTAIARDVEAGRKRVVEFFGAPFPRTFAVQVFP